MPKTLESTLWTHRFVPSKPIAASVDDVEFDDSGLAVTATSTPPSMRTADAADGSGSVDPSAGGNVGNVMVRAGWGPSGPNVSKSTGFATVVVVVAATGVDVDVDVLTDVVTAALVVVPDDDFEPPQPATKSATTIRGRRRASILGGSFRTQRPSRRASG